MISSSVVISLTPSHDFYNPQPKVKCTEDMVQYGILTPKGENKSFGSLQEDKLRFQSDVKQSKWTQIISIFHHYISTRYSFLSSHQAKQKNQTTNYL